MAYDTQDALALIRQRIREHENANPARVHGDAWEIQCRIDDAYGEIAALEAALAAMKSEAPTSEERAEWRAEMDRLRDEERRHERYLKDIKLAS